jgi:hypothetical protein
MARHNREGAGIDQRGVDYRVSFQPDWLHQIKVTRSLGSGRQSTKTLIRNPAPRERDPGPRVRTRITSEGQALDFEIALDDPRGVVRRVIVETGPAHGAPGETLSFIIDGRAGGAGAGAA